jgi:hypothetical protein
MPLGAKNTPFAPGVCGKGCGGFLKFQLISAGLFSIFTETQHITWGQIIKNGHSLLYCHGDRYVGFTVWHQGLVG